MILAESSQVAQRNLEFYKNSFGASVEKNDCVIDCMPYGSESRAFTITKTDGHVLRYCVPMDNQRPELDLKFYKDICPDKNSELLRTFMTISNTSLEVPVIVVFTKYDQFLRNVEMQVLDYPKEYPNGDVSEAAGKLFQEHYLDPLGDDVKYVQLESESSLESRVLCQDYMLMLSGRDAQAERVLW
jgi:hypothetical protein